MFTTQQALHKSNELNVALGLMFLQDKCPSKSILSNLFYYTQVMTTIVAIIGIQYFQTKDTLCNG
jgi:hypothetical protein